MHVSSDEKAILAPAMRRACTLLLHVQSPRDMEGITCVLSEITTVSNAKDTILALLLLHDNDVLNLMPESTLLTLRGIAACAALKEI